MYRYLGRGNSKSMRTCEEIKKELENSMKISLNDNVRVILTCTGIDILEKHINEENMFLHKYGAEPRINPYPMIDMEGHRDFQLHRLMYIFGERCQLGLNIAFQNNEIIFNEVK